MKRLVFVILATALLCGCSLTPTQKKWAGVGASVLIVGAIAAHKANNGEHPYGAPAAISGPASPCSIQPDGSCR